MPERFIFRQVDIRDLPMFFADGEVRSKNHPVAQHCHQTSYPGLVSMRNTNVFALPTGGVVNDYVAFYFSPITSFTYTIHSGNVEVVSPTGQTLGPSGAAMRVFLVARVVDVFRAGLVACFSDAALNSCAPMPRVEADPYLLSTHVDWSVFDEAPITARIPEIGYLGVCQYFQNRAVPANHHNRSQRRMAEFLVAGALPLNLICCVVTPDDNSFKHVTAVAQASNFRGEVVLNRSCFV